MSSYQTDIIRFRRYTDLANYIGGGIGCEFAELKAVFVKPLYKGGEPNMADAIDELGDCRYFLAEVCTLLDMELATLTTAHIPTPPLNLYSRLTRMTMRAEHIGNRLIEHWRKEWFIPELRYTLFDLEEIRRLTGQGWVEIEQFNIDKLTKRHEAWLASQQAAAL